MKILGLFLLFLTAMIIAFQSCRKDEFSNNTATDSKKISSIIKRTNDYRPERDKLAKLYHSFISEMKNYKESKQANLKDDPNLQDGPIDEGIWLIETGLNNEYGLKNDSIAYERDTVQYYSLEIIDYNPEGIPIVHGDQLDEVYLDMEGKIIEGNGVDNNFWMCIVELDTIMENTVTISILPFRGKIYRLWCVLPPGVNPEPFPAGTSIRSCNYYNGIPPLYQQIESRIRGGSFIVPGPENIFVYYGWDDASFYTMLNWPPDTRFWGGTSPDEMVNTEGCNYYLFAQKNVVDGNNPNGNNNIILGTLDINWFHNWFYYYLCDEWHTSDFYYFEIVYVGNPY